MLGAIPAEHSPARSGRCWRSSPAHVLSRTAAAAPASQGRPAPPSASADACSGSRAMRHATDDAEAGLETRRRVPRANRRRTLSDALLRVATQRRTLRVATQRRMLRVATQRRTWQQGQPSRCNGGERSATGPTPPHPTATLWAPIRPDPTDLQRRRRLGRCGGLGGRMLRRRCRWGCRGLLVPLERGRRGGRKVDALVGGAASQ
jgi:hypothetical protein